jgi:GNAT superfamily N-acetyltransferase
MNDAALAEYPKTVVLKDGAHVVLRPLAANEGERFEALLASLSADERREVAGAGNEPVVLAFDGADAVGAVWLERGDGVGTVRVVLAPRYRGRRLGTWMLLDAVHLGAALGLARLVAPARPDDTAYRATLRRLDFVEQPSGESVKTLHAGWPDF